MTMETIRQMRKTSERSVDDVVGAKAEKTGDVEVQVEEVQVEAVQGIMGLHRLLRHWTSTKTA